ncbi:benzoyl-CoA reductase, bzd-type, Q subunit [Ferroglobus placidus DSM 10642]|uniref:Benzoyl-CoA reductase, bzd-type, Q subunit n=1 Tax=Ferroglobus placidus (strain DSM 10642 / AEDII12DO) TaxID=589924 RepID=D3RXY2_FERPA|nr:benzoyl-CoA reductase, bzd-type, subunit Q [Ferroglobus placidus]ADC65345.1 benzoyl-CoA reductase, bzd-type, Q subunit [Ferroglobus placidus DSM 10642]QCO91682.1 bzd-type benzoyl-CoA reductase subunit Q [synthetic construct]
MVSVQESEYWKWPEQIWVDESKNWKDAEVISCGIDLGSVSTQAVIMLDGELYAYANMRTGTGSVASAERALNAVLKKIEVTTGEPISRENIHYIVATGYGRVSVPFANKSITEIACHGRGAVYIYGDTVRTVLDMGGQDLKAIKVDSKGKVVNFLMNDKCAAGTGRGIEVVCDLLAVPITEAGELSLKVDEEPEPVSTTCVVFAKSEILGLIRKGWSKEKILAAFFNAVASRVVELLERVGVEPDFAITGGISKNIGVVKRIEDKLGIKALKPKEGLDPQLAGAIGAALFARALYLKEQKKK